MNLTEALSVLKSRLEELHNARGTADYVRLFVAFENDVAEAGLASEYSGWKQSYLVYYPYADSPAARNDTVQVFPINTGETDNAE